MESMRKKEREWRTEENYYELDIKIMIFIKFAVF